MSESRAPAARDGAARLAFGAAALIAGFAAVFTAGEVLGVWPQPPAGAFVGWDLWTGFAAGLALLVHLVRGRSASPIRI